MRTVFTIFAIVAVACCAASQSEIPQEAVAVAQDFFSTASEFKEEAPVAESLDLELIASDAKSQIKALKKGGATEKDCQNLADDSCKEVLKGRRTSQSVINRLADGRRCLTVGNKAVTDATKHWHRMRTTWLQMKKKVTVYYNARVHFRINRSFSSLRVGKCGFIFGSRNYITARNNWNHAKRVELMWRGKHTEALKSLNRFKKMRITQQRQCHCNTRRTEQRIWTSLTRRSATTKATKAYAKCQMMACVLKGISLKNSQCRKRLPALRRKVLSSTTRRTTNCKGAPRNNNNERNGKKTRERNAKSHRERNSKKGGERNGKKTRERNAKAHRERNAKAHERNVKNERNAKRHRERHAKSRAAPEVFQHCNFGGYKRVLKHSTDWVAKLGIRNDDLSSIKVPRGKCVTLYEHSSYRGRSWRMCGPKQVSCFVHHKMWRGGPNWNDKVSSIRVTNRL